MQFIHQIKLGLSNYKEAHRIIFSEKWFVMLLVPGIIHFILFIIAIIIAQKAGSHLAEELDKQIVSIDLWDWLNWLEIALSFIIGWIIKMTFIAFYFLIYKYIILILLSPIFSIISEKVETKISGKVYQFNLKRFFIDIYRGIRIAGRNSFYQIMLLIVISLISFVPIVTFLVPFAILILDSYYFGFSMMDYYNERQDLSRIDSIARIREHKGVAIGNGLAYYTIFLIPFIGWVIAPIYSIVVGTISAHHINEQINAPLKNKKENNE